MLAVLTQRLGIKIFARQHSGIQHWALWECERPVHCSLCCKISTQHHLNAPTPPTLLTLTGSAQTNVQHAWLHVCSFTHTHTCSKVSEMPSEPPDEKTSPHKQALLMQGEALLFSGTMSVLTFLCLHILSTKSTRKNWGGVAVVVRANAACNRSHWHVQTYTSSPFISRSQTIFYSTIMLGSSSVPLCIWWRYVWAANLAHTLSPPLTHKRHFARRRGWWWCSGRVI